MSVGDTSVRDLGLELEQRAIIRAFLDAASQGIIAVNQSRVIVLANARAHEMFGYAPGELVGQRHEVLLPEHLRDIHANHAVEYFRHPRTRPMGVGLELRGRKKDGTEFHVEISLSHVQEGGHRLAFAFVSDITERKRMEEAERRRVEEEVRASVVRLRVLYDMAAALARAAALEEIYEEAIRGVENAIHPDRISLLVADDDGVIRFKAWRGLSAQYREAVEGHTPWQKGADIKPIAIADVMKEESLRPYQAVITAEGIRALAFIPLVGPAGVVGKFMLYYNQPHEFGAEELQLAETIAHHVGFALARKRAEEEYQAIAQLLTNVLESITDSFIALDHDWRYTYLNDRAQSLLGASRQDALGKRLWEVPPTGLADLQEKLRQALYEHRPVHFQQRTDQGIWYDVQASHTNYGLAVFVKDFTGQKRMEEHLRQAQKLESIGVLAGGIAHDFNNLMAAVLGNASLALDTLPPGHPARPLLESVTSASERAAHLTGQLLAYAGKGRFVLQPTDLSSLVRDVMGLIQASIPRTVHVQLQLDDRLPPVESDPAQLRQLVMNLVLNAIEAIPEGRPGLVRVATGLEHVSRDDLQNAIVPGEAFSGEFVVLRVEDTGVGMSSEMVSKIFDPFFTTKFIGRGLGLAAVLGIVRAHKGALTVQTAPGRGTRFTVLLPPRKQAPQKHNNTSNAIGLSSRPTRKPQ